MALSCPSCGKTGSSHLATHCDTCETNGIPVMLIRKLESVVIPEADPQEITLARQAFIAASKDDFEGYAEARAQLAALGISKPT